MATKVHQNIDWQNAPSNETPINEDNLNKMDKSIDEIDDRVVGLMGYEQRVAEATEQNEEYALTSKSYAVGATGIRENEDKDNSKYYSQQARTYSQNASSAMESAQHWAEVAQELPQTLIDAVESNTEAIEGLQTEQETQNVHLSTLDEEQAEQNERLDEIDNEVAQSEVDRKGLELFGWIAPRLSDTCYDYIENGVYHKRVGRVDFGSCVISYYSSADNLFFTKKEYLPNQLVVGLLMCERYTTITDLVHPSQLNDKNIEFYTNGYIYFKDSSFDSLANAQSKLSGVYLYYELATEQTYSIYNPNVLDTIGTTTNLFNPTASSSVVSGTSVTVTANGDGTYTANGSNTGSATVFRFGTVDLESGKTYKLVGAPSGCSIQIRTPTGEDTLARDDGNGVVFTTTETGNHVVRIYVDTQTYSNAVFKPMVTTNLQATISDFVRFTGSTGKLNSDVSELRNDVNSLSENLKIKSETIIAPNESLEISLASTTRCTLFIYGAMSSLGDIVNVTCTSSGNVYYTSFATNSKITYQTSSRKIKITNGGTQNAYLRALILEGDIL